MNASSPANSTKIEIMKVETSLILRSGSHNHSYGIMTHAFLSPKISRMESDSTHPFRKPHTTSEKALWMIFLTKMTSLRNIREKPKTSCSGTPGRSPLPFPPTLPCVPGKHINSVSVLRWMICISRSSLLTSHFSIIFDTTMTKRITHEGT